MSILVLPRATEKAYRLINATNTYVFDIPLTATKRDVTNAIESQFEVKVVSIKTLVQSGKAVRFSRGKSRYPGTTNRRDSKKAYVSLAKGDSIHVFDEPADSKETK